MKTFGETYSCWFTGGSVGAPCLQKCPQSLIPSFGLLAGIYVNWTSFYETMILFLCIPVLYLLSSSLISQKLCQLVCHHNCTFLQFFHSSWALIPSLWYLSCLFPFKSHLKIVLLSEDRSKILKSSVVLLSLHHLFTLH